MSMSSPGAISENDKVLGSLAWKWCADTLLAVARGEVASCKVEPVEADGGALATVVITKFGGDESRDSWTMGKVLADEIACRIIRALVLRGKTEDGASEDIAPAHPRKREGE